MQRKIKTQTKHSPPQKKKTVISVGFTSFLYCNTYLNHLGDIIFYTLED